MKLTTAFLTHFAVFFFVCFSWAGENPNNLWLAKSFGSWTEDEKSGYYRVMVYRAIGESSHGFDSVFVDILERGETRGIKNSVELDTPGYKGYVRDVSFKKINATTMAVLLDIEMKAMDGLVLREVFLVSPDGSSRKLVEAKYQDIYGEDQ